MKPLLLTALLTTANAIAPREYPCAFHLRTEGGIAAPVGQFDTGQAQAGQGGQPASFSLDGSGLVDGRGRACWWTPPALVLQCDAGQAAVPGFGIGCDGLLSYDGQTRFQACRADGGVVISRAPNGSGCTEITLRADGCLPAICGGGGGGGGGASNTLPLQSLTNFPGLFTAVPGASTTATATLPLQGLTNFPGLFTAVPPSYTTASGTLPLQGLTGLPGLLSSVPGGAPAYPTTTGTLPLQSLTGFPLFGSGPAGGGATTAAGSPSRRGLPDIAPPLP
ncbi:hypothetical protein F4861DRAFT_373415 [Xylaria intraflava]|nr:hypothetical protein F4861DRAFT_373415 [Xylaria intraflava]